MPHTADYTKLWFDDQKTDIQPVPNGQEVLIVIGENLNQEANEQYWGKSKL